MSQLDSAIALEALFFFSGSRGRRLLGFWHGCVNPKCVWLFLPPFAEERQVSHAICVQAARALAQAGQAVLRFDLSGTADSEGDLEDATWDDWLADSQAALLEIKKRTPGLPVVLWGLRTGAALALDLSTGLEHSNPDSLANDSRGGLEFPSLRGLVLWQPVLDTEVFIQQFLRQKIATALAAGGTEKVTVKSLLESLKAGETVEIAGYPVRFPLIEGMVTRKRRPLPVSQSLPCKVILFGSGEIPLAISKAVETANLAGGKTKVEVVDAEPFWDRYWKFRSTQVVDSTVRTTLEWQMGP